LQTFLNYSLKIFYNIGPDRRSSSYYPQNCVGPEPVKVPNIPESQRWIKQANSDLTAAQLALEAFSSQVVFKLF